MLGDCARALIHKFWVKVVLGENPWRTGATAASQCSRLIVTVNYFLSRSFTFYLVFLHRWPLRAHAFPVLPTLSRASLPARLLKEIRRRLHSLLGVERQ